MVTIGIDAHKRSHTAVACDEHGRELGSRTVGSSSSDHAQLLGWARQLGRKRRFAVEDNRALSRRLEHDLIVAGEQVVRVPPKLMSKARAGARTSGKSDRIDALAVARAALREPGLAAARPEGAERELRLLVDHREDLVGERTRLLNRLHVHLHELDPQARVPAGSLRRPLALTRLRAHLQGSEGLVASLARELVERALELTLRIDELEREIAAAVEPLAPSLLSIVGCGHLTAAKIVAETAGVERFRAAAAYARYNGTAPLAASSAGVRAPPPEPLWQPPAERRALPDRAHAVAVASPGQGAPRSAPSAGQLAP